MKNFKNLFKLHIPTREEVQKNRYLSWIAPLFQHPDYWQWNRLSVAKAVAIALFSAWMPIPFQLWLSAFLAIYLRANLPVALTAIWVSNPVTLAPMVYFSYWLGSKILHTPPDPLHFTLSWEWFITTIAHVWEPLFLGAIVCGIISAIIGYFAVVTGWHFFQKNPPKMG